MLSTADVAIINELLRILKGRSAHTVFSGYGSFVQLQFGEMITNSDDYSRYELVIFIQHCAWRIETETTVLLGCEDKREEIDAEIKVLENLPIVSAVVSLPSLDTTISFENGIRLRLFPRHSTREPRRHRDEWTLFLPDGGVLAIKSGGQWYCTDISKPV